MQCIGCMIYWSILDVIALPVHDKQGDYYSKNDFICFDCQCSQWASLVSHIRTRTHICTRKQSAQVDTKIKQYIMAMPSFSVYGARQQAAH
jgi:hypothetical protein